MSELTYIPSLLLLSSSFSDMPELRDIASLRLMSLSSFDMSELSDALSLIARDQWGILFVLSVFSSLDGAMMGTSWPVYVCMALSCCDMTCCPYQF